INQAVPVINWTSPAPITAGTPLGTTQLNATATGVGGASLEGSFVYLPALGSVLAAGDNRPISVEFIPGSANYTRAIKTVTITVLVAPVPPPVTPPSGLAFRGFFRPVHNLPDVNRVRAGSAIPVRFWVEGARRSGHNRNSNVLKAGSPASVPVACEANATGLPVEETFVAGSSQLRASGDSYTYIWKTSSTWTDSCRKLVVTLIDGSTHSALFRFEKASKPKPSKGHENEKSGDKDKHDNRDKSEKAKHGK
ncbi:MAG TPA: PxKF domain-containing protein, partial [Gemmatimonadales bacterium]|nr:PxKF domain-containing protein [Gemmatimonadales bacterium]